ncbi:KUP/HAK/KT family potassium transporter [Paraclostridium bifermentans]|uniref:Probable potassium transport system protein Kup n=1 Tax=Paraclostridium bifermentans TaxID=1490 RepID=A0A5P3XCN0_PARBF|nr:MULTISPECIES: KUP/HAK/KT family potassium transporter [Paraclostridium]MBZ6005246.1 KUP/HAK/KT family potassium transporter [Paraclostridium bifermentans]MCU9808192.1 KUP/HAK/KT family potassium transporter [Paraclostridium sp. AKS46]MDU0298285.1 KUP/HAK/KT family potassium transporter [Paraclostridium sp. MRS3W1]QEZ68689.1 potassium transporter Kup [Paraclostridium bifermentans]
MSSSKKVSIASLLVALGIVYGDIGTSPLYVMKAILATNGGYISNELVLGGVSLVFWTLTLQTTIKYVILTLKADNNGEGGIFSLYTLVRKRAKWLIIPAVIGGAALLADGMITPPVTVTSAIEGLNLIWTLSTKTVVITVIFILIFLFSFQKFGTAKIGKLFGPMMFIWFSMLAILGVSQIVQNPYIVKALNPYYAINLLIESPKSTYILGAVFLCTTGAEALYSDLGHCGRKNIYYTWTFVKLCLVLNYLGQGAWLISRNGERISQNPFFLIMPQSFIIPGVIIATLAAIIASQALISGSFTLISEAIKLNLFPRLRVRYPNEEKGQIYIPAINYILGIGCILLVLYFKKSENMEAAYGLAITVTMLMTTILLSQYQRYNRRKPKLSIVVLIVFGCIELSFLYANLFKFFRGGYITLCIGLIIIFVMYTWIHGTHIKQKYSQYSKISDHLDKFEAIDKDVELPIYATHTVYLTQSQNRKYVENKILHSIFNKRPKRSKYYWFIHVKVTDEPYTMNYKVFTIKPNKIFSIEFQLGFRVSQRINVFLREVIQNLISTGELEFTPKEYMLDNRQDKNVGDFKFVLIEEALSNESNLSKWDNLIMSFKVIIKRVTVSPSKWFGIDTSIVEVEKVPITIGHRNKVELKRVR